MCDGNPTREFRRPERDAAGRGVRVVDDDGYAQEPRGKKRREGGVPARREYDVGIQSEKLHDSADDTDGIGEYAQHIEQAAVAAHLTRGAGHVDDFMLKERFSVKGGRPDVVQLRLDEPTLMADILDGFRDSNKRVEMPARSSAD